MKMPDPRLRKKKDSYAATELLSKQEVEAAEAAAVAVHGDGIELSLMNSDETGNDPAAAEEEKAKKVKAAEEEAKKVKAAEAAEALKVDGQSDNPLLDKASEAIPEHKDDKAEIERLLEELNGKATKLGETARTGGGAGTGTAESDAKVGDLLMGGVSFGICARASLQKHFIEKDIKKIEEGLKPIHKLDEEIEKHNTALTTLSGIEKLKELNTCIEGNTAASEKAIAEFKSQNKGVIKENETPEKALEGIASDLYSVDEDSYNALKKLVDVIDKNTAASEKAIAEFKSKNEGVIKESVRDDQGNETTAAETHQDALKRLNAEFKATGVEGDKSQIGHKKDTLEKQKDVSCKSLLKDTKKSHSEGMSMDLERGSDDKVEYQRTLTKTALEAPGIARDAVRKWGGGENLSRLVGGITAAAMVPLSVAGFMVDSLYGVTIGLFARGNIHNIQAAMKNRNTKENQEEEAKKVQAGPTRPTS